MSQQLKQMLSDNVSERGSINAIDLPIVAFPSPPRHTRISVCVCLSYPSLQMNALKASSRFAVYLKSLIPTQPVWWQGEAA